MEVTSLQQLLVCAIKDALKKSPRYPLDLQINLENLGLPHLLTERINPVFEIDELLCTITIFLPDKVKNFCDWYDFSVLRYNVSIPVLQKYVSAYPDEYGGYYLEITDVQSNISFLIPDDPQMDENVLTICFRDYVPDCEAVLQFLHSYLFEMNSLHMLHMQVSICAVVASIDKHEEYEVVLNANTNVSKLACDDFPSLCEKISSIQSCEVESFFLTKQRNYF
jgi:hypothetical protein